MTSKIVLTALLAVLCLAAAWFWLRGGAEGPRPRAAPARAEPASSHENRATETLAPALETAAPAPAPARTEVAPRAPEAAAPLAREHASFDTDGARWLEIAVVLPGPLEPGDEPSLLGFSVAGEERLSEWRLREIGSEVGLGDGFVDELDEGVSWSRVPLATSVRLPFPKEAERAVVLLQSRLLWLAPVQVDLDETSAITIRPELGARATGRVVLPAGAESREIPTDEIEVGVISLSSGGAGFPESISAEVRADLTFELRALSPRHKHMVMANAPGLVFETQPPLVVRAGEERELVVRFELGATIAGRVTSASGEPIEGAQVRADGRGSLFRPSMSQGKSGADGSFELRGLSSGKVEVSAEKAGWTDAEEVSVEVADGARVSGVELVLERGERIAGRVLWPDGTPAARARVEAHRTGRRRAQVASARADAEGVFELTGLAEGSFDVLASARPKEEGVSTDEADPGDDAADEDDEHQDEHRPRGWTALSRAVEPGAGVVLTLEPPLPLAGVVVDDAGEPVGKFSVLASPDDGPLPSHSADHVRDFVDGEDGRFALAIPYAGTWRVTASADLHSAPEEPVRVRVPADAEVRVVLARAATVSGKVVDPSGRPVAGATVGVQREGMGGFGGFGGFEGDDGTTDVEGSFELEDLSGDSVTLVAQHPDWADSEPVSADLSPGGTRAGLVLRLRVGARITGEVFDAEGRPEAGQNVALGAMFASMGDGDSIRTDEQGRFVFERVTPGKVTVVAMPSEEEMFTTMMETQDESAMMSLFGEMRSATVQVADGAEAHVVLGAKPKQPVRVHGRVTEAGRPLAGASVVALAEGGPLLAGMKMASADGAGRYEIVLDRPGDYTFGVNEDGSGMESLGVEFRVEIPEVESHEQDLALPLGSVSGRVLAPDGSPAADVSVRIASAEGSMGISDLVDESRNQSTGADGAFRFEHLHPGRYTLAASPSMFGFGTDDERFARAIVDGIEVPRDRAVSGIDIRLRAPGKLAGVVRNSAGDPVAGAAVFVRDAEGRGSPMTTCVTDGAGRFTHGGLPPGPTTALARTGTLASPESRAVVIRSGETSQVELVVGEGAFLVVSLLEDGEPVRAHLRVLDEAGRRVDGLFSVQDMESLFTEGVSSRERRVGPLAPGEYTCSATTPDGKTAKKPVTISAGSGERTVKLRLR